MPQTSVRIYCLFPDDDDDDDDDDDGTDKTAYGLFPLSSLKLKLEISDVG